jgi:N-acetyl-anhydromuramyl-L-alanine amidase AmpD
MAKPVANMQELQEIPIGELNDISFDMESPLVTNDYNGQSLMAGLFDSFLGRESVFNDKRPHKGVVLLSSKVRTQPSYLFGLPLIGRKEVFRNFAVIRVPEIHGHIPPPDMQALSEATLEAKKKKGKSNAPDLETSQKLLISMHDAYFSVPIEEGSMKVMKPGDIVFLDGDGLIVSIVEPAEIGFFARAKNFFSSVFDFGGSSSSPNSGYEEPSDVSPYGLKGYNLKDDHKWSGVEIHYSAAEGPAENAVQILAARGYTYHFHIDRSGVTEMLIDPDQAVAHHSAGTQDKDGDVDGKSNNANIGICFANLGHGMERDERVTDRVVYSHLKDFPGWGEARVGWPDDWVEGYPGAPEPGFQQASANGDYWQKYTPEQLSALGTLIRDLQNGVYGDGARDIEYFSGHEDNQANKSDPGPAFTIQDGWDVLRNAGLKRGPNAASTKNTGPRIS